LVGTGAAAAAAAARGSFVAMASRPSFVVCCDDAYAQLLDAVLMRVHVKRNAESQTSMQDVSWPVGLPSNNSLDSMLSVLHLASVRQPRVEIYVENIPDIFAVKQMSLIFASLQFSGTDSL
jgi:hypothetical protein